MIDDTRALRRAVAGWQHHLHGLDDTSPAAVKDLLVGASSLPELFAATAARFPDRKALTIDGASLSHGELDEWAARMGGWLAGQGISPGDAVLLCAHTSLQMIIAYLGLLRAGAVVVLANPASRGAELQHMLAGSGARVAVVDAAIAGGLEGLHSPGGPLNLMVEFGHSSDSDDILPEEIESTRPLAPFARDPNDVALIAHSSGTTGAPKTIPLSHQNVISSIKGAMMAWRWSSDDTLVHALPLFHQHGLGGLHATLIAGSETAILSRFDPATWSEKIVRCKASVVFAVPTMYQRFTDWAQTSPVPEFSSVRLFVSGSAPLSPVLAEQLRCMFGQIPLERYGLTETGLDVSNPYKGSRRTGTVGLPLPGVEIALVDREGKEVEEGHDGEIAVRGPQVFSGYSNQAAANAESFLPGGWFRTGDLGTIDPSDGYLTITGRLKELIITGGMNVYPREVELALEADPAIAEAAVVGVPSADWGEEVVGVIVRQPGTEFDAGAVLRGLRDRLSAYRCPKRLVVVEALPRTSTGKLSRVRVSELLANNETAPPQS